MFEAVARNPTLTETTRQQLEKLILKGSLGPGDRLPSEKEMGEMLGVSRTVIRQAIHLLTAKGLLVSRSGSGTYVRRFGLEVMKDPIHMLLQANILSSENINEAREILEINISGLAAERATATQIEEMGQSIQALKKRKITGMEFARADVSFHVNLAKAAHNPLLLALVTSLNDLMMELRLQTFSIPGIVDEAVSYHSRIIACVKAHDLIGARKAMEEHLKQSRENLNKSGRRLSKL